MPSSPLVHSEISQPLSSPTLRPLLPRPPQQPALNISQLQTIAEPAIDIEAARQQHAMHMQHLREIEAMLKERNDVKKRIAELQKELGDSA